MPSCASACAPRWRSSREARRHDGLRHPRPDRGDDARPRVAVMRDGKIVQVAEPQTLYSSPSNLFVAAFIGSPAMNLVEAVDRGRRARASAGSAVPRRRSPPVGGCGRVVVGIRPEAFEDAAARPAGPSAPRRSTSRSSRSSAPTRTCSSGSTPPESRPRSGRERRRRDAPRRGANALHGARRSAHADPGRPGTRCSRSIPRRFHFFDPGSGRAAELRGAGAAMSISA